MQGCPWIARRAIAARTFNAFRFEKICPNMIHHHGAYLSPFSQSKQSVRLWRGWSGRNNSILSLPTCYTPTMPPQLLPPLRTCITNGNMEVENYYFSYVITCNNRQCRHATYRHFGMAVRYFRSRRQGCYPKLLWVENPWQISWSNFMYISWVLYNFYDTVSVGKQYTLFFLLSVFSFVRC